MASMLRLAARMACRHRQCPYNKHVTTMYVSCEAEALDHERYREPIFVKQTALDARGKRNNAMPYVEAAVGLVETFYKWGND